MDKVLCSVFSDTEITCCVNYPRFQCTSVPMECLGPSSYFLLEANLRTVRQIQVFKTLLSARITYMHAKLIKKYKYIIDHIRPEFIDSKFKSNTFANEKL